MCKLQIIGNQLKKLDIHNQSFDTLQHHEPVTSKITLIRPSKDERINDPLIAKPNIASSRAIFMYPVKK